MTSLLDEHWGYVSDPVRLGLFERAIRATVRPGMTVADLGSGSGVLTLLALRAGAARVYCVEATRMLDVARETLVRAGLGERVTFVRGRSQKVDLPGRVDVAMCDNVGWFGFDYDIVHFLRDARLRFLEPGGTVLPAHIVLRLAPVESARCYALADRWGTERAFPEFHWVRQSAVNTKHSVELQPGELLGGPVELGRLDLAREEADYFSWSVELSMARDGLLHGIAGWFDCELSPGVWMTNSPLETRIDRPQVFLPIEQATPVRAGERVRARVMARPARHLIAWEVELPEAGRRFAHSSWAGMLFSPEDLVRAHPEHVPRPSREGLARGIVLGYCDGRRSVREIEQAVLRDHPGLFPSEDETCRFVVDVLASQTSW